MNETTQKRQGNFLTRLVRKQIFIPLAALLLLIVFNLIADPSFFAITLKENSLGDLVLTGNLITILDNARQRHRRAQQRPVIRGLPVQHRLKQRHDHNGRVHQKRHRGGVGHGQGEGLAGHDGEKDRAQDHAVQQVGFRHGAQLLPEDDAQHHEGQAEPHRQQIQRRHALQPYLGEQQRRTSGKDHSGQQPFGSSLAHLVSLPFIRCSPA